MAGTKKQLDPSPENVRGRPSTLEPTEDTRTPRQRAFEKGQATKKRRRPPAKKKPPRESVPARGRHKAPAKTAAGPPDAPAVIELREFRRRQNWISRLLDNVCGPFNKTDPDSWDRRAYHQLVGLVYERLATCGIELPTEELARLARSLADHRRIEGRAAGDRSTADGEVAVKTEDLLRALPSPVADAVRDVYGAGMDEAPASDGPSEGPVDAT